MRPTSALLDLCDAEGFATWSLGERVSAPPVSVTGVIAEALALLDTHAEDLATLLYPYTSRYYVEDEIRRSRELLEFIHQHPARCDEIAKRAASFAPRNQLIYSFYYLGLAPALSFAALDYRPPACAFGIVRQLANLLRPTALEGRLEVRTETHAAFSARARGATFVYFTGKSETAEIVATQLSGDEVFVGMGSGHNPVIVGRGMSPERVAIQLANLVLYNQGQDCSAPSAVLCEAGQSQQIVELLAGVLEDVVSADATVVPSERRLAANNDRRQVRMVNRWIESIRAGVRYGGSVDVRRRLVHPTVIEWPLDLGPSYREWFAPVAMVQPYHEPDALRAYFATRAYERHRMYVTVFGDSPIPIEDTGHEPDTVLLGESLLDAEKGYLPYGGYGTGASWVKWRNTSTPSPICAHLLPAQLGVCK